MHVETLILTCTNYGKFSAILASIYGVISRSHFLIHKWNNPIHVPMPMLVLVDGDHSAASLSG